MKKLLLCAIILLTAVSCIKKDKGDSPGTNADHSVLCMVFLGTDAQINEKWEKALIQADNALAHKVHCVVFTAEQATEEPVKKLMKSFHVTETPSAVIGNTVITDPAKIQEEALEAASEDLLDIELTLDISYPEDNILTAGYYACCFIPGKSLSNARILVFAAEKSPLKGSGGSLNLFRNLLGDKPGYNVGGG
jgi:hypothetical protein